MNNPLRLFSFIRNIHIVLFSVIFCSPLILTSQVLLSESFNGVSLPAGWTATDLTGDGNWLFDNPEPRTIAAGTTAFDANFAIFDSDYTYGNDENATLESPSFDASAAGSYYLDFDNCFRFYTLGYSQGIVEVYNGTTWTAVLTMTGANDGYPTANHKTIDITAATGNSANAKVRFHWLDGSGDWYWAIDNIKVSYLATCTGAPTVGAATSEMLLVCPTDAFRLDVPKVYNSGITYRWQASTNGGTSWNFISAASADTFYTVNNQNVNTQYRAVVYCGTDSTISNVLTVNNKPLGDCYCTPVYTNGCVNGDFISSVVLGSFTNTSGTNCGTAEFLALGYSSFTSLAPGPEIIRGNVDTLRITNGTQGSAYYAVWVDLNNNGIFETTEKVGFTTTVAAANSTTAVAISVPVGTAPGQYRMRIRLVRSTSGSSMTACASYANGETEDYLLNVIDPPSCSTITLPTTIVATSSVASVCVSDNVIFDVTTAIPNVVGVTYQWESSTDGGTTWNAAGAVKSIKRDTLLVNTDADYRLNILCNGTNWGYSDTLSLIANNPQVLTVTDSSRCGYGTVDLEATASTGATLNWYQNATGGAPLGTGTTFTTPSLGTSTTYYVAATVGSFVQQWLGTGTLTSTGTPMPYYTGYYGSKNQYLVRASELQALGYTAGYLGSIGFDVAAAAGLPMVNFTIRMGTTSLTTLTSTFQGGLTQVYTTPLYTPTPNSVNTHQFQTPFLWDGVSNIIVETCYNNTSYSSGHAVRYTSSLGFNASLYNYADNATVCSMTTGYTSTSRPNILFVQLPCESARQPVVATITTPPSVTATATATTICKGGTTDLSVTSSNPDYTYEWLPGNLTGATETVQPTVSTQYIVVAEDLTTGPFEGCVTTDTINITVDSVTVPLIKATPDTLCSGEQVTLAANISSESLGNPSVTLDDINYFSPFSYSWDATKVQYILRANELSALGLQANSSISSFSIEVVGNAGVALKNFTVSVGATSVVSMQPGTYASGLTQILSVATFTPVLGTNTFTFPTPFVWDGVSSLAIQFCHDNGCFVYDYTLTPHVRGEELVDAVSGFTQDDCSGSVCSYGMDYYDVVRPIFTFDISGGGAGFTHYVWTPMNTTGLTATDSPVNTSAAPIDQTYTLTVTDPVNSCSATRTVDVHVYPAVHAEITSDETVICANDNVGFYLDAQTASSTGATFTWLTDNSNGPTFLVTQSGTYILEAENAYGCTDKDTIVITSVNPVIPVITADVAGGIVILDAGTGFDSYSWSTLESSQTINVQNGTYTVETVDSNGCTATSAPITIKGIGLNENGTDVLVSVFPNPSNGIFTLQVGNLMEENMRIDIIDINGKIITNMNVKEIGKDYTQNIDLSNVAAGTYFIKLSTTKGSVTERIVIVR